jgi:hypothetical protein
MFYVYGHYRKTDDSIFYIGVAKSEKRFTSKYSRNNHWKNIVKKNGFYYKILLESEDWTICLQKEIELINYYGRLDLQNGVLCNMTNGGEGCVNLSNESKNKISEKLKGIKRSDEFKEAVRNRMIGSNKSIETRIKMSNSHKQVDKTYLKNKKLTEEHKKNISKSKKGIPVGIGKKLTEEHKKSISNGFKVKFNDIELKEIIEMYNNNISLRKIALKFNTNHQTIKRYIKKKYE